MPRNSETRPPQLMHKEIIAPQSNYALKVTCSHKTIHFAFVAVAFAATNSVVISVFTCSIKCTVFSQSWCQKVISTKFHSFSKQITIIVLFHCCSLIALNCKLASFRSKWRFVTRNNRFVNVKNNIFIQLVWNIGMGTVSET